MAEETARYPKEFVFALLKSPVNGTIVDFHPTRVLVRAIIMDWTDAGGFEALVRANIPPDSNHWVTMPRSILSKHDLSLPPIGRVKLVALHVRIFAIYELETTPQGVPVNVPIAETVSPA